MGRFLKENIEQEKNSLILCHAKIYEEENSSLNLCKRAIYLEKVFRLKSTEASESNNLERSGKKVGRQESDCIREKHIR